MTEHQEEIKQWTEQLRHKTSAKRRIAAKRLRKLKTLESGPAVLAALHKEMQDPRTWETQYQMIMALGESGYKDALPFLNQLATKNLVFMVLLAVGDAIVRLGRADEQDAEPILELLSTDNRALIEGGLRAIAMLRLKLKESAVQRIIEYASNPENEQLHFWIAAAAAGWNGAKVDSFLRLCANSSREDTRMAAAASANKKYLKWNPL